MQVKPNSETLSRGRTPLQSSLYSKLPNKRVGLTYLLLVKKNLNTYM